MNLDMDAMLAEMLGGDDGDDEPCPPRLDDDDAAFEAWVSANLTAVSAAKWLTAEMRAKHFARGSIWMVIHKLRWETYWASQGANEFKIPSLVAPRLARLLMAADPSLAGFFVVRAMRREYVPSAATIAATVAA